MRDDGLSNFKTNVSRSQVNWNVNEDTPECALVQPEKGHTMIQLDGTCGTEVVAGELIEGFTFEPRCLVLVMALKNERAMFDSMLAAGRDLTDGFVNYNATQTLDLPHRAQIRLRDLSGTSDRAYSFPRSRKSK